MRRPSSAQWAAPAAQLHAQPLLHCRQASSSPSPLSPSPSPSLSGSNVQALLLGSTASIFSSLSTSALLQRILLFEAVSVSALVTMCVRILTPELRPTGMLGMAARAAALPLRWGIWRFYFRVFTGGETFEEATRAIQAARSNSGVRAIIDHSTEEFEDAASWDGNLAKKVQLVSAQWWSFGNNRTARLHRAGPGHRAGGRLTRACRLSSPFDSLCAVRTQGPRLAVHVGSRAAALSPRFCAVLPCRSWPLLHCQLERAATRDGSGRSLADFVPIKITSLLSPTMLEGITADVVAGKYPIETPLMGLRAVVTPETWALVEDGIGRLAKLCHKARVCVDVCHASLCVCVSVRARVRVCVHADLCPPMGRVSGTDPCRTCRECQQMT
jgi:hypothetical protein